LRVLKETVPINSNCWTWAHSGAASEAKGGSCTSSRRISDAATILCSSSMPGSEETATEPRNKAVGTIDLVVTKLRVQCLFSEDGRKDYSSPS